MQMRWIRRINHVCPDLKSFRMARSMFVPNSKLLPPFAVFCVLTAPLMTHCSWGDIKASSGHTLLLEKGITCPKCTVKFLIISGHISHASELPIIDPDPWESFHLSLNPASGLGSISTFTFLVKKDITFYWLETFFFQNGLKLLLCHLVMPSPLLKFCIKTFLPDMAAPLSLSLTTANASFPI